MTRSWPLLALVLLSAACARGPRRSGRECPEATAPGASELARGYAWSRCGRLAEAITAFSSAAASDPENKRARMELGYARQAAGDFTAAADDFALVAREPGEFQEQAQGALKALQEGGTSASDSTRQTLLDAGYEALRKGQNAEAREKFKLALASDPGREEIAKQLGYMSLAEGDLAGAARDFEGARRIDPEDCASALELGYLYARLHNDARAEKEFISAQWCPDPKVREAAAAALKNIRAADSSLYLDLYAAPLFTSRFQDKIAYAEAVAGWKPVESWPVSLLAVGRLMQDSRSRAGDIPEIYSDNAASLGPGVRLQPKGSNLALTAELSPTLNLTRGPEHPDRGELNKRVVLTHYLYGEKRRLFADLGASAGWYSRYRDNVIAYAQARAGVAVWEGRGARVSLYAPLYVSKDSNEDFFNNYAEFGAGAEVASVTDLNLKLRFEYLRGNYMGIEGRDRNPYPAAYHDVRASLIWSMRLSRERRRKVPPPGPDAAAGRPGLRW